MKTAKLRISISLRGLLATIALAAVAFALVLHLRPVSKATAIRIARRHALETYPGINLDEYAISAPPRYDWGEEWYIEFRHKSRNAGFDIEVAGGEIYTGGNVRAYIDEEWGDRP
jgi:hypothetical protein